MPIKAYVTLKASITSVFPSGKGTNKKNRRFSGISWKSSISQSSSNESVVIPKNRDTGLDRHQGHCIRAHICATTTDLCAYSSSPVLGSDTIDNKMPLSGYDSHPFHQSSLSRQSVSVPSLGSLNLPMGSALMTVSRVVQDDHFPSFVYLDSGHPPPTTNCTSNAHYSKNQDLHGHRHCANDCAASTEDGCNNNECQSKDRHLIADGHVLANPWATYELVQRSTPKVIQTLPGSDHTTIKSTLAGGRPGWRMCHAVV